MKFRYVTSILVGCAAIFIFSPHVFASTIVFQSDYTATSTSKALNGAGNYFSQTLGTGLTGTTGGAFFTFQVASVAGGGNNTGHARLYECASNTHLITSCTQKASQLFTVADTNTDQYVISWASSYSLLSNKYYLLVIDDSGFDGNYVVSGSATDKYTSGDLQYVTGGSGSGAGLADIGFVLFGSGGIINATFANVANNGTYQDFYNWQVNVYGDIAPGDLIQVKYGYNDLSGSVIKYTKTDQVVFQFPLSLSPLLVSKQIPLNNLASGTIAKWNAYIQVLGTDGSVLFASNPITFTVNLSTAGYSGVSLSGNGYSVNSYSSAATHGVSVGDCSYNNSSSSWVISSSYQLACWLFKPADLADSFMSDQYTAFQGAFPFSLFYQTVAIVSSTISGYGSSTSNLTLTVQLPTIPGGAVPASSTITFVNGTTMQDTLLGSYTNSWFNLVLMIAIVVFVWGLFSMIFH